MGRKNRRLRPAPSGKPSPPGPPPLLKDLSPTPEATPPGSFWRRNGLTALVLCGTLLAAGALRMVNLGSSPPGTLDDECVEIWNAFCLLKTGQDSNGQRWPLFSTRGQGDNRPVLFMYCLMPFQAIFGMSVWSARFGTAVMGTLEVLLIFVVGSRMFGRPAGLAAAVAMALCPWHLRNSRFAFMANSFFITLPLAMLLLARLPLGGARGRPRPVLAFGAGAVTGLCCYGYPSIRIFLPVFLLAAVAVAWRGWWELLRTRRGAVALAAAAVGLAFTLGPLAWAHIAHPEQMAKRTQNIMVWDKKDSLAVKACKAAARYPIHFAPDFLFVQGDGEERSAVRRVPGTGAFQWYLLPFLLVGAVLAAGRLRRSRAERVLLAAVLLYPVADLFFQAQEFIRGGRVISPEETKTFLGFLRVQYVHLYRSLPGLPVLILLAAYGAAEGGVWLWRRSRRFFWPAAAALAAGMIVWSVPFFQRFYVDYNRQGKYYDSFEGGLVDALRWVKPRFGQADALFISMGHPKPRVYFVTLPDGSEVPMADPNDSFGIRSVYLIPLVELGYDPREWFADSPEMHRDAINGDLDWVSGYGKVHLGYSLALMQYWRNPQDPAEAERLPILIQQLPAWRELRANGRSDNVYMIVQPEYPGVPPPVYEVRRQDGRVLLWVCRAQM